MEKAVSLMKTTASSHVGAVHPVLLCARLLVDHRRPKQTWRADIVNLLKGANHGQVVKQYMAFKLSTVNLAEQLVPMTASKLETLNFNRPLLPLHGTMRVSARNPPLIRAFSALNAQYK